MNLDIYDLVIVFTASFWANVLSFILFYYIWTADKLQKSGKSQFDVPLGLSLGATIGPALAVYGMILLK